MSESKSVEEGDHEILLVSSVAAERREADLESRSDMSCNFFRGFRGSFIRISIIISTKA
jgi:hypothetical protein